MGNEMDKGLSGLSEDGMGADATPDHVRLTLDDLITVFKGGAAVVRPRHLENALRSLDALHPEALAERLAQTKILDELPNRHQERSLLGWCQSLEVGAKARKPDVRGHEGVSACAPASPVV